MRKIITVPKNQLALKALDYDSATADQLYEISLSESQFKDLWDTGIFDRINEMANVNIDYFEDEQITNKAILEKIISNGVFEVNFSDISINETVKEVKGLFMKAIQCETGVFFFF
ncbi:hypothetical protein A3860_39565 [Niastella vici]|uniref:Uncharacterized protein n=1 Tax=Niastella vici TaxID=1703345 RepID=A0A1V9FHW6_9BACT|nr:hypothetical protein [Niastella vici]OQP57955.1 hypothetical protein A3860_39565 [Niastella vici]